MVINHAEKTQELLRLEDDYWNFFLSVLALNNVTLRHTKDGQGHLIELVDSNSQSPKPLSTTGFLLVDRPTAGMVVAGRNSEDRKKDELYPDLDRRRQDKGGELSDQIGNPVEVVFYNIAILDRLIDNITARLLQETTGVAPRQMDLLISALKEYGLSLNIEFFEDYVLILFQTRKGRLVSVPIDDHIELFREIATEKNKQKAWSRWRKLLADSDPPIEQIGGFIIPVNGNGHNGETNNPNQAIKKFLRSSDPEAIERASEYYQNLSSNPNAKIIPPFSAAVMRSFIESINPDTNQVSQEDGVNGRRKAPTEVMRWKEKLLAETKAILGPLLESHGLELFDLKDHVVPGRSEDIAAAVYDNPANFPLVDLLIVCKGTPTIEPAYPTIKGWKKDPDSPDSPTQLVPYGTVTALVIVPDSMPLRQRKKLIRDAVPQLRRLFPSIRPKPMVLTVTPSLLEKWKQSDEIVLPELTADQVVEQGMLTDRQAPDYGYYNIHSEKVPQMSVSTFEPQSTHIGGTQIFVNVDRGGGVVSTVVLDLGWIFDLVPTFSNLGSMPPPIEGIAPFLRVGMFDQIARFYRLDLILASINYSAVRTVLNLAEKDQGHQNFFNLEEFLLLEAYHRLGEEALVEFLRNTLPDLTTNLFRHNKITKLLDYLKKRQQYLYKIKRIFDLIALSHAHQDHSLGVALANTEIPLGLTEITRALALADHKLASNWLAQDVMAVKLRSEPMIGSSYPVKERPYYLFGDGDRLEVSPGVFVTAIEVKHSIPGSVGFVVELEHQGKIIARVGYPGDYKDGRFFEQIAKMGKFDLLFVEGTNPLSSSKDSAQVTENMVATRLDSDFKDANDRGDTIVIDVPKNSLERVSNIIKLAQKHSRVVLLSPKMIRRIMLLNMAIKDPEKKWIPELNPTNPSIACWTAKKARYTHAEKEAFEVFGSVTVEEVSARPGHFVILRETESFTKLEGLSAKDTSEDDGDIVTPEDLSGKVTWIDSTYGPYTQAARNEKRDRKNYARKHRWTLIEKGRHASGHVRVVPKGHPDYEKSPLRPLEDVDVERIAVLHTQKPVEIAEAVQTIFGKKTKVGLRREHPRHKYRIN